MPENFASLLEALNTEGRELAQPVPAGVIETRARGRRRRRRFTTGTSALAVCAIATAVVLGTGGTGAAGGPKPIAPASSKASAPSSTPAHQAAATKNRTGGDALLLASEAPQPKLLQWQAGSIRTNSKPFFEFEECGFDTGGPAMAKSLATSEVMVDYTNTYDGSSSAVETVYHYASVADARHDFAKLAPDQSTCKTAHVVGTIPDGFAWTDGGSEGSLHKMLVLSQTDIAFWFYQYQGGAPYDTAGDQAALQRMADRLDGGTPAPDRTPVPPGTLLGSAWLDVSQIPFGTADKSHGWYAMGGQQQNASSAPPADLCEAVTEGGDFVGAAGATVTSRNYHGTPTSTPVYAGSNYLYSSAYQNIVSFSDAAQAQSAFAKAKQATSEHSCQFKDGNGVQVTRTLTVGTVTDSGFSLLATDKPGPSYAHLYCVIKGSHVSWMMINFEQGDISTGGDAAILAAMTAHLP